MPISLADRPRITDAIANLIRAIENHINKGKPPDGVESTTYQVQLAMEALQERLSPTGCQDGSCNADILNSQLDLAEKEGLHKLWVSLKRGPLWPFTILNTPQLAIIELASVLNKLGGTPPTPPGSEQGEGAGTSPKKAKSRSNRGRKEETDKRADKQIWDAWKSGEHKDYEALAGALGMTKLQVQHAIDRHRKWLIKRRKPAPE